MSNIETLEKLLSFAFVMSENMVGLSKGNYDEATFIKKTYVYLHKYNVDLNSKQELEKSLQRLEAIDNAKPSEALEELFKTTYFGSKEEYDKINSCYDSIKQALVKAQEQEEDIIHYKGTVDNLRRDNALLKDIKNKQEKVLNELINNHIEFVVEKDRCYFKIKNSKGKEKSFTSYTMLDFWKEVLEDE